MKLTDTNNSIGLIFYVLEINLYLSSDTKKELLNLISIDFTFCWPGGFSGEVTHDPISNSNVKGSSADGTLS